MNVSVQTCKLNLCVCKRSCGCGCIREEKTDRIEAGPKTEPDIEWVVHEHCAAAKRLRIQWKEKGKWRR
eukprot:3673446-Pleurochrysis_carterae.AAC.2